MPAAERLATAETSVVYYDDGKAVIGRYAEVNREIVTLDEIPDHVELAVLAAEDRGFYENEGISPAGIVRALWNNIRGGDTQGASTITQQYAQERLPDAGADADRARSRRRSSRSSSPASQTKEQVLEDYLNTIYFGRGAYGIQAASQAYFGKDVAGPQRRRRGGPGRGHPRSELATTRPRARRPSRRSRRGRSTT